MRTAPVLAAVLTVTLTVAVAAGCSDEPGQPTRDALVGMAKQADATLDDATAGCLADGLTEAFGPDRAASILQTRPPETLSPADEAAAATVGVRCTGAPGVSVDPARP